MIFKKLSCRKDLKTKIKIRFNNRVNNLFLKN